MFVYCLNNPVNYVDNTGMIGVPAAWELLRTWLNGDGSTQYYGEKSNIVKALKKCQKMSDLINLTIDKYKTTGKATHSGWIYFGSNDSLDLHLAARNVSYTITVKKERRTVGIWLWKWEQIRYAVTVKVNDTYDFNGVEQWDSLPSIANNIAYLLHIGFYVGKDYKWYATYTHYTKWEDNYEM